MAIFIVKTNKITPGDATATPLLIAQTQSEFQRAVSDELAQQMIAAMKADQGIKRNEEAIAAASGGLPAPTNDQARPAYDDRAADPGDR